MTRLLEVCWWVIMAVLLVWVASVQAFGNDHTYYPGRQDHIKHVAFSTVGTLLLAELLKSSGVKNPAAQIVAGVCVFTIGDMKESEDPIYSHGDMVANGIGVTLGMGLSLAF